MFYDIYEQTEEVYGFAVGLLVSLADIMFLSTAPYAWMMGGLLLCSACLLYWWAEQEITVSFRGFLWGYLVTGALFQIIFGNFVMVVLVSLGGYLIAKLVNYR